MREKANILPLNVEGITYSAGGRVLIDGISFLLPRGGVTCILGPNGAGKSLLLRLCHGLIKPEAGQIQWANGDGKLAGRKRHGMVFQSPVMLRRSGSENIEHALRAAGLNRAESRLRAAITLERFGLSSIAAQPARFMSGGEQQRLAIARAWALRPELIFLDEPCSQLDPGAVRQIEEMLYSLEAEGVTLVMTTHDLGQARRIADNIMFLNRGRLLEMERALDFFAAPKTAEARAFLAGDLLW